MRDTKLVLNTPLPPHGCCAEATTKLCPVCSAALQAARAGQYVGNAATEFVPAEDGSDADEYLPMAKLDYRAISGLNPGGAKFVVNTSKPAPPDDTDDDGSPLPVPTASWYRSR